MSENIAKFFYQKTSNRVNKKWDLIKGGKSQNAVLDNRKLFSHVLNCKIEEDNPYLLTPTSMKGIVKNLKYSNDTELMFGTKQEIEDYAEELFCLIFDEYIVNSNTYSDDYQIYYCDYLPYAKNYTFMMLLSDESLLTNDYEFRETLLGTTRQNLDEQLKALTIEARHFLYINNQEWFLEILLDFISKTSSFKYLPKKIDTFANEVFTVKLKEHIPSNKTSLGLRVKEILENDLAIRDKEIRVFNWQNEEEEFKYRLFRASLRYVNELEKIFRKKWK